MPIRLSAAMTRVVEGWMFGILTYSLAARLADANAERPPCSNIEANGTAREEARRGTKEHEGWAVVHTHS